MFKIFKKNKYNSGITMVELIVVISIFLILTSITIFNYGQFRSSLSIQNLADDISLVIRKAQSLATGVLGVGGGFSGSFGVHFTADPSNANNPYYYGSNKQFVLFFDRYSPYLKYNYTGNLSVCGTVTFSNNECLEAFRIKSNDKIDKITIFYSGGGSEELDSTHILNIIFERPKTEPVFCRQTSAAQPCGEISASYVQIKISSINEPGIYRYIKIYNSGQISVSR